MKLEVVFVVFGFLSLLSHELLSASFLGSGVACLNALVNSKSILSVNIQCLKFPSQNLRSLLQQIRRGLLVNLLEGFANALTLSSSELEVVIVLDLDCDLVVLFGFFEVLDLLVGDEVLLEVNP